MSRLPPVSYIKTASLHLSSPAILATRSFQLSKHTSGTSTISTVNNPPSTWTSMFTLKSVMTILTPCRKMSSPAQNSTPVPRSMTYAAAASASASTSAAAAVPVTTPFAVTSPRNNNESVPVAGRATAPYCSPQAHGGEFQHPLGISRPFAQMAYTHRNTRRHAAAEPVAPVRRRPGSSASFSVPAGRPSTGRVNLSAMTGTAGPAVQIPAAQIPAAQIPAAQVSATEQHQQAGGSFSGAIGVEREAGTLELTDVPQRRVLATTLAVVRSRVAGLVAKHPDSLDAWQINEFLKRVFPRGGQAETIHCSVLSAVETSYR